jgi:hypothetical protein
MTNDQRKRDESYRVDLETRVRAHADELISVRKEHEASFKVVTDNVAAKDRAI